MLRGEKKLTLFIEKFYKNLGYDEIECFLDADFAYYQTTNEISYSLLTMPVNDAAFSEYLKEKYPDAPQINMFVFSLLHELGHYLTLPLISKKKRRKWRKKKKMLEKTRIYSDSDKYNLQLAYCNLPDERIATQKAVELLINNYDYVKQFEANVMKKIFEFYEKNLDS